MFLRDKFSFNSFSNRLVLIKIKRIGNINDEFFAISFFENNSLPEILISQDDYEFELVKITFSSNGFLTVEEKDLKTIYLGFNPNLINYQLQIINHLKNEFKKKSFIEKLDNIDLTNPKKPKIKVFKP